MIDKIERIRLEAVALRAVMDLEPADRAEAAAKLDRAAVALPGWLGAVRRELLTAPAADLEALWGMLDARPALAKDRADLEAAGVTLEALRALDPAEPRAAYAKALEQTREAAERRSLESALRMVQAAAAAEKPEERRILKADALAELTRAARDTGGRPIAEAWEAYRAARFTRAEAGPDEVLRLNPDRGSWAAWMNAWMGNRRGLEAGRCMMIGARPGAGKTSLGAALAVDAMAAGVPVLFWQLELSREETLEHLLAQVPAAGSWYHEWWTQRVNQPLPEAWTDLLTVPAIEDAAAYEADTIREAMQRHAAGRGRRVEHAAKGLVIVDYAQLLTVRERRASTPQHEQLTKAASMLAKAAADLDLCLVLLSQLRKVDQDLQSRSQQSVEGTAFVGGDLNRMAHCAFALSHGGPRTTKNSNGNVRVNENDFVEVGATGVLRDDAYGELRILAKVKDRGFARIDDKMPAYNQLVWMNERTFNDGNSVVTRKGKLK